MKRYILITLLSLTGCNLPQKLSQIGEPPPLTQIQDPTKLPNYEPVQMPMPKPTEHKREGNTLWEPGSRAFFKDQRAGRVGDILTVHVLIDQSQSIEMKPDISRTSSNSTVVTNALGFESKAEKLFPKKQHEPGKNNSSWLNFKSNPSLSGNAKYDVSDKIQFKMAVHIIQILPNGNLVVQGREEIRLIDEVREVVLKGIVRREDISSANTVGSDKIAELRISYGGRGELTDMQRAPWRQQIINKVLPF